MTFESPLISFRLDSVWRTKVIREVLKSEELLILDLGSGTGISPSAQPPRSRVTDELSGWIFFLMLLLARPSSAALNTKNTYSRQRAISPFKDCVFDGVMTAFVLRNVSDLSLFFTTRSESSAEDSCR